MEISGLRDLIGGEFKHGAAGPDKYDCYNLAREVFRRNGMDLPAFESSAEPDVIHGHILEGKDIFEKIGKPEPMSLVLFQVHPKYITHIGVVLSFPWFIHIMKKRNACIERLDAPHWARRIEGFYRWNPSR